MKVIKLPPAEEQIDKPRKIRLYYCTCECCEATITYDTNDLRKLSVPSWLRKFECGHCRGMNYKSPIGLFIDSTRYAFQIGME